MKAIDSDQKTDSTTKQIDTIDPKDLAKTTGGYRTDGVDSPDYQSWYFGPNGPGRAVTK